MSETHRVIVGLMVVAVLTVAFAMPVHEAQLDIAQGRLDPITMANLSGGSFWTGLGCGFAAGAFIVTALSPDPGTKLVTGLLVGTILSCGSLYFS